MDFNEYKTEITCPSCGKKGTFLIRTLIDPAKDPDAVSRVLNADWFTYTCPHCGERQILTHTCLFHSSSDRILYALADSEEDYEQISAWMRGVYQRDELDGALNRMIRESDCRLVRSLSELQEKLLLHVLGLDDRPIELCKIAVERILIEKKEITRAEHMYFNTDGTEWILVTDAGEEGMRTTDLPRSMYEDFEAFLEGRPADSAFVIDRAWALRQIQ